MTVYTNIFKTMCMKIPSLIEFSLDIFIELFKHMKMIGKADTEIVYKAGSQVDGF